MASLLKIVVTGVLGVLLGLLVTIWTLDSDARGIAAGPWRGSPREGTPEIDPYALAAVARAGLLPLGASEGLSFTASADRDGAALSPACDYTVTGPVPAARYWTLSVLTPDGFPIANPAGRHGFTSAEVLRENPEGLVITLSAQARAGNWLPVDAGLSRYVLMLRLYDTSLSAIGTVFTAGMMPAITKIGCH